MHRDDARSTKGASTEARFLDGVSLRPVSLPSGAPLTALGLALGLGTSPLELLVTTSAAPPNATTLRSAWKARNAGRAAPLLLVVLHAERASLCGPAGDDPPAALLALHLHRSGDHAGSWTWSRRAATRCCIETSWPAARASTISPML